MSDVVRFDINDPLPVESIWNQIFEISLFPRPYQLYMVNDGEPFDMAFFTTLNLGNLGALEMAVSHLRTLDNSNAVAVDVRMYPSCEGKYCCLAEPASSYS